MLKFLRTHDAADVVNSNIAAGTGDWDDDSATKAGTPIPTDLNRPNDSTTIATLSLSAADETITIPNLPNDRALGLDAQPEKTQTKTPWFATLWKRKKNEQPERGKTQNFFPSVFDKKTSAASAYETLDEQLVVNSKEERGDEVDSSSQPVTGRKGARGRNWRRVVQRRFRTLGAFSRRKWRGLRRAGSLASISVRNAFSRLSLSKTRSRTEVGSSRGTPSSPALVLSNEAFEGDGETSMSCPELSDHGGPPHTSVSTATITSQMSDICTSSPTKLFATEQVQDDTEF